MIKTRYLLDIAIILLSTKLLGLLTRRVHLPQVVGALLAGLLLGPQVLGLTGITILGNPIWLERTDFIDHIAELGVIVLMFSAGLSTSLKDLKDTGKAGFVVALCGVLVPLALGTGVGFLFPADGGTDIMRNIILGTVITATSVSITVETLREMGKLNTKVGATVLAAALIDDILGLLCLTVVTSFNPETAGSENIWIVVAKIAAFFVFVILLGIAVVKFYKWYISKIKQSGLQRFKVLGLALCLALSFAAERFFGVADIIGAFAAGLIVGSTESGPQVERSIRPLSYLLLTPVFFANVGLGVELPSGGFSGMLILFAVVYILAAVISKLFGCGIGAKLCGMSTRESVQVGLGMACRGEVALIVANKGANPADIGPIVLMIVFTAIVTPALIKLSYRGQEKYAGIMESGIVERFEMADQIDTVTEGIVQTLIKEDKDLRSGTHKHSFFGFIKKKYHKL